MKLIVIKDNLKTGISIVEKSTLDSNDLPILKNILIEAESNNRIKLSATNLEIGISYFVSGKVIETGKTAVPANVISNLIGNIPTERLNFENKNNNLEIKTDNYEAIIQCFSADDFPIIPKIKDQKKYLEFDSEIINDSLNQVISSTQFSELHPELNSIFFDFNLDTLKIAATDGFRLAEKTLNKNRFQNNGYENGFNFLLPIKTATEILRILKEKEKVKMYYDESQVLFKTDNFELISRLVQGNFPDYVSRIPSSFSAKVILNRQEFINAIRLASVFSSKNGEVTIKSHKGKKALEIYSKGESIGQNTYTISAKIEGNLEELSFNWKYLLDGVKSLKTENLFFGANKEENIPSLLKSSEDDSYFYILMPLLRA